MSVDENSIDKTTFVTPDLHYEFLRMPFRIYNSPSVFQRIMNNVLGLLKNNVAFPYKDNFKIPSRFVEVDLEVLRAVLQTFRKHNLTLKIKYSLCHTKINYFGHEISANGI